MDLFDPDWARQLEVAAQVIIAGVLGGFIGLERELANRPAGVRTHAILGAAAALLVGTADLLVEHFMSGTPDDLLRVDPIRVVEAVVTGVAFLGAGTIFRHRGRDDDSVEGLTTAASLLLVAAIGVAVAIRQLLLALLVTVVSLVLLRIVGRAVNRRRR